MVMCNLLAVDGVNDPDVLCINAASAALCLSDIPWNGPVGAVRIGYKDGECIINPTRKQMQDSEVNLVLAASVGGHITMMEMNGNEVSPIVLASCITHGLQAAQQIIDVIAKMRSECGKPKRPMNVMLHPSETVAQRVAEFASQKLLAVLNHHSLDKLAFDERVSALRQETTASIQKTFPDVTVQEVEELFSSLFKSRYRQLLFETGCRYDGRKLDAIRPIECQVDLFKPLHGSALFQRGQTQVLCTVTFDSIDAAFHSDAVSVLTGFAKEKRFMLHYVFPPYCNNEISTSRAAGRRELGHGALAEKALRPIVPVDFPFTIRVMSEVLESNGSSSMASVCGGSLALMDAGVPVRCPVAGVAVGLVTRMQDDTSNNQVKDFRLLTDISGLEDYLGDMDFKMASTNNGFTALQLDTKIIGLTAEIVLEALERGHDACRQILRIMT
ncbi:unnamed protein product, partial [Soboliphyme baturini]|uniref:Polyribonucleotide nucleotidyltransferase n=1 Tax=Soboliphyme baturini TaxID=241478 RepID=A0A183IZH3_9BILA